MYRNLTSTQEDKHAKGNKTHTYTKKHVQSKYATLVAANEPYERNDQIAKRLFCISCMFRYNKRREQQSNAAREKREYT